MSLAPWPFPPVLAHRCGGALAPENTLAGLDVCAAIGCHGVEFDAMLSADGEAFVIHDESLERTTSGAGRVAETTAAALRLLDAGAHHHKAFAGEALPDLAAVLARCVALGLAANVEIKSARGHEIATGTVVAQVVARQLAGASLPVLLSSFSSSALAAARQAAPLLPRALLRDYFDVASLSSARELDVIAIHCNARYLSEAQAAQIRGAGFQLAVYTENNLARAQLLRSWGVASVISDRPERLLSLK